MEMSGGNVPILAIVAPIVENRANFSSEHQPGIGEVEPPLHEGPSALLRVEADIISTHSCICDNSSVVNMRSYKNVRRWRSLSRARVPPVALSHPALR